MRTAEYNEYIELAVKMESLYRSGMNALNPVIRSIARRLEKLYKQLCKQEQTWIDDFENIPFR